MSDKIIQLNEDLIKRDLKDLVRCMNMDQLFKPEEDQLSDIIAGRLPAAKRQDFNFVKNY